VTTCIGPATALGRPVWRRR